MKIKSAYILFILGLYPIFYFIPFINRIGFTFENIYYLGLLFPITLFSLYNIKAKNKKNDYINIALLAILILVILLNTSTYFKPLIFFFYLLISNIYLTNSLPKSSPKLNRILVYIYLLVSIISIFNPTRYLNEGRFSGFMDSPTVFSVYLEFAFIIYLYNTKKLINKIIVFVIIVSLIFLSQTRLNLVFLFAIPVLTLFANHLIFRKVIFIIFFISLNALYPAYDYMIHNPTFKKYTRRKSTESQKDDSFGTRMTLFGDIKQELRNSSSSTLLFGHGAGYMRNIIHKKHEVDVLPHNDFLRFIVDFGFIAFIILFIFLYRISIKTPVGFLISLLYLLSFYHNMIYTYMLISIIIYLNFVNKMEIIKNDKYS